MDPALWELLRAEEGADGDRVIEAIIRLARPGIEIPGVRIVSRFGTIATCRIPAQDVIAVRARPDVLSVKAARGISAGFEPGFEARVDPPDWGSQALPSPYPTDVRRSPALGLTGAGVVVAAVDWGVDVDSAAFRRPADPAATGGQARAGATRFLSFWDQRDQATGPRPDPYGYGSVHSRAEIDRALKDPRPYERLGYHPAIADPSGRGAHGTRTMDIAAGNGQAGGPAGIAPGADLVFVHLADRNTGGLANFCDSVRLLEAIDFISRTAGSQPCVINISAGRICGPKDGTTLVERAFDELLAAAPGRFVVNSAGNYFQWRAHACGTIARGEARSLTFVVDPADSTVNELEIWYDGADEFAVRIDPPGYTGGRPLCLGERSDLLIGGRAVGRVYHREDDPNNGDNHIVAYLDPIGCAGTWTVTLEARRVTSGRFHAWIERDDSCPGCQARFTHDDSNAATTIGSIATSHLPLIVGAYDGHDPARPVAAFSSGGPCRDGRCKPDLAAPGVGVLTARSAPVSASHNPGLLARGNGTSFATPHVTGAVALCFEAAGNRLGGHEIRSLVLGSCDPVPDADPQCRLGRGYLNIPRLVAAVQQALATPATAPGEKEPTMNTEDPIVLLAAAPATAYREYLYRPRGQLARWIGDRYHVVARPGQPISQPLQDSDVLLEVTLGRMGGGRCVTLNARDLQLVASRPRLAPGQLLLRPRPRVEMSEPLPVEPTVAPSPEEEDTDLSRLMDQGLPEDKITDPLFYLRHDGAGQVLAGPAGSESDRPPSQSLELIPRTAAASTADVEARSTSGPRAPAFEEEANSEVEPVVETQGLSNFVIVAADDEEENSSLASILEPLADNEVFALADEMQPDLTETLMLEGTESNFVSDELDFDSQPSAEQAGSGSGGPPSQTLDVISGRASTSAADVQASLRILRARLAVLGQRYPAMDTALGPPIGTTQTAVSKLLAGTGTVEPGTLETAVRLIEWAEYDLVLLDQQRTKLVAAKTPLDSLQALRVRYGELLGHLLQPDALDRFQTAQQWMERMPNDVLLDALQAHGNLNKKLLTPSAALVTWVDDLRTRLDTWYDERQELAAKPGDPVQMKAIATDGQFLELGFRAINLYYMRLVAFEQFIRNRPGVLDTPLVGAMNRLRDRVEAMKAAYDAHDSATLKARVESLESDKGVKEFLTALPAAMQVTQLVARVGVATLAALASGGFVGLLTGGGRAVAADAAATEVTMVHRLLTFAGTAVLEAATFTAVSAAANALLFGDKLTFGSVLKDFAWNLGLFTLLGVMSNTSTAALRAADLQLLSAPVQLKAGFGLSYGYGVIRFRIEHHEWPKQKELDAMSTEALIMMAGLVAGSKVTGRWLEAHKRATAISAFYRDYGWRFEALNSVRADIANRVLMAEAAGKGNDQATLKAMEAQGRTLEKNSQELLDAIRKDKRFPVKQIRDELNSLREISRDIVAELLADVLKLPPELSIRRAGGRASYTYLNAKTGVLEKALSPNYTVTKSTDATTGLRTVTAGPKAGTATSSKAPTLMFQERSAGALDFDHGLYDVQNLMREFSITDAGAQRMTWRILADYGITKDAKVATTSTRALLKRLQAAGRPAEAVLRDMHKTGRLYGNSSEALKENLSLLMKDGILRSPEWLDARDSSNQKGVTGEWLARRAVPPGPTARVLRRLTVQADFFEDAAGQTPAKDEKGAPRVNWTATEADLLYVRDRAGTLEVEAIVNIKSSGEKNMAREAKVQNANFHAVLASKVGDIVKMQDVKGTARYARVRTITALDGATTVDVTGKLVPSGSLALETFGPKGANGFTQTLNLDAKGVTDLAALLNEQQLIEAGDY